MNVLSQLSAHFPAKAVSWRCGPTNRDKTKGMALAYIDARDVMQRLDDVCGAMWQSDYLPMPNGTCCCRIGVLIDGQWVWRSSGAVNIADSDKADAKEMAEKGSYSDAFKRAAVMWGIGRYLYDLPSPWVEIDERKQITEAGLANLEARLREYAKRHSQAPLVATPPPAPAAEAMDPETGELSPPSGNVVREVIKAHEPAPATPEPAPERKPGSPPSCIIPGSKKTPEEIAARKAREKAEAEAEARRHSKAVSDEWCVMLRDVAEAAADPANDTRKLVTDFEAWDLVRKAMWSQIREEDQPPIRKAYLAAKRAIDKRRASKAA